MDRPKGWLARVGRSIWAGVRRFPAAVLSAAAIMALALILVHNEALAKGAVQWLQRVAFTLGLAVPLCVALRLFLERAARPPWLRATLWVALAALLALYLLFLMPKPAFESTAVAMRYLALLVASVALVVAVPYLPRGSSDERFALKLLWRLFITGVFSGVLFGGIALVLLMLDKLLAVAIGEKAYLDAFLVCAGLFAPSFFLAGVPAGGEDLEKEPYQPLMRVLIGYIVFPLLAVYTAIIYVYFITMLVRWSWPSNMLVNLVLWYTAVGVLALYFLRSQSVENRWFRFFDRWYPQLTALPIALLFIGLFIRIGAYGFTEPRYFVLVLAVWVTALTALAVLFPPERRRNIVAPALLAALALLAVLGPWSAFSVSRLSQNLRLEALLARNGMLAANHAVQPKADVPEADKRQIYGILDYFSAYHELADARVFRDNAAGAPAEALLGFGRPGGTVPGQPVTHHIQAAAPGAIDVNGYEYLFHKDYGETAPETLGGITMTVQGNEFIITRDGRELYRKSLDDYARQADATYLEGKTYTPAELTFDDDAGAVRARFLLQSITVDYPQQSATPVYTVGAFYALVDVK